MSARGATDFSADAVIAGAGCERSIAAAYQGLLAVCGRAKRPETALQVAYAAKKDGVVLSPAFAGAYYQAKKQQVAGKAMTGRSLKVVAPTRAASGDDTEGASGGIIDLARIQSYVAGFTASGFEALLDVECGLSRAQHASRSGGGLPVNRIRIRW